MQDHAAADDFLNAVAAIRQTRAGTPETTYYPAIANLLNAIGGKLKPHVLCVPHPANGKAGIPDFGLFEQVQFRKGEQPVWVGAVTPQRGVVEVKPSGQAIAALLASDQLRKQYLPAYGLVLACNLYQWRLLAALLDPEAPVPGVTTGTLRPELAGIGVPSTAAGLQRDWGVTAGWGNRTEKGITMPGRGKTDARPYSAAEAATAAHAALLGAETRDIWMNGASYWRNIPAQVWETHIGGYQVLKKWLSYREHSILDRPLHEAEVAHVQATARRLAALLLLGPALDASHHACAAAHVPLGAGETEG